MASAVVCQVVAALSGVCVHPVRVAGVGGDEERNRGAVSSTGRVNGHDWDGTPDPLTTLVAEALR